MYIVCQIRHVIKFNRSNNHLDNHQNIKQGLIFDFVDFSASRIISKRVFKLL